MTIKHFLYLLTVLTLVGCGGSDTSTAPIVNPSEENAALPAEDNTALPAEDNTALPTEEQITLPAEVEVALNAPLSTLTQDLQDSITHMYSEEGLAHDVYLNIYKTQALSQLQNIAMNSEVRHTEAVNQLAIKYDLNITKYPDTDKPYSADDIARYGSGEYPVEPIQELYNLLYDKGIQSKKDAFEVGCMVEVIDIDDLDEYIEEAQESNAPDVLAVFEFLRNGSYEHYWAFDKGLKSMGEETGCCSVPDFGEHKFCHPEYPQK